MLSHFQAEGVKSKFRKLTITINFQCLVYNSRQRDMTKISRGGYFRPRGGYFLFFNYRGVYTPLEKPEVRLLALLWALELS